MRSTEQLKALLSYRCSFTIVRKFGDFLESLLLVMNIPGIKHFHKKPRNFQELIPSFGYSCYCYWRYDWTKMLLIRDRTMQRLILLNLNM